LILKMKITFTRTGERTYTTVAARDDGVTLHVPSHDRPALLPHDLAHFIVEQELGLKQGFWGSVAAGALFPGMTVVSGRQPPHAADRSRSIIRAMGQLGTEAEVLVGVLVKIAHAGMEENWEAARSILVREWRPNRPSRDLPTAEEVRRVSARLREAQADWQSLPIGESLTVTWFLRPTRR
jgi:hypothetical protein